MNKRELILKTANLTGYQQVMIEDIFDNIIYVITSEIAQGQQVSISGFGNLSSKIMPAKTKIHNITKEEINVEEKMVPRFKCSNAYKEKLNQLYKEYKK
ncbi:HU family DNA-binding protein [[Mycoplasma] falconis]|uniref:HU family DNA-binding protein n=1 Tax=[Mycoplasma] falconis TaxID=92403 RepID=A0A501XA08_9BACT|nr:HU family DNA-binding protein [[Mycoplasma] falconis]TPE57350.1 HU family DNA-binding protein [[Mycoplasma] falconis]